MNKLVLLCGYGRMGKALKWAFNYLNYNVITVDTIDEADIKIKFEDASSSLVLATTINQYKPALVFSSLPYYLNTQVARTCIELSVPYADLGGRVDVSDTINILARKYKSPVATDLGLAPGFVNILAERAMIEYPGNLTDLHMGVGGLPMNWQPHDPRALNYVLTWSIDGLLNEYTDDCQILSNGVIQNAAALSMYEPLTIELTEYEWFLTSGGASHTLFSAQRKGVNNCTYRTIRYRGHKEMLDHILQIYDRDKLAEYLKPKNSFEALDYVLLTVFGASTATPNLVWYNEIHIDCNDMFSAMQMATAFPAALCSHDMTIRDLSGPVNYEDFATFRPFLQHDVDNMIERCRRDSYNENVHD